MKLDPDRNLLFGIVALQFDFIGREQLIESMNAWSISKDRSLADVLEGSGALTPDCRKMLDTLVSEHVKRHGGDAQKSLAAMPVTQGLQAVLHQFQDPDSTLGPEFGRSLRAISQRPAVSDPFATTPDIASNQSKTRFRVLRAHAQGGLGTVSVARDEELNREVALKEIQAQYADDPSARSRFVLEAEVTGGLEHPNIVPVYGLGYYTDGRPYYAMRFIKGESLKEVCDRFHEAGAKKTDTSSRMVALRNLLGRFVDVCQAIDYAHSRGVIHRDLKPGNIMLGEYGETLVVDWGLAKASGASHDELRLSTRPVLTPTATSSVEPTQMGSTLGTLQFMSPEQAAGRTDLMGPASDIYSLGATLYYMLTGRPSVSGNNVGDLLRAVQGGDFPRPSELTKDLPRALEAICLKGMALEPRDRYGSAKEMAQDLECWLADEPVSSYRESGSEKMARWLRRHRTWFRAVSAAVGSIIVILSTAVVLINQQRHVADQNRSIAEGLAKEKSNLANQEAELRKKAEWQSASRAVEQSVAICQHVDAATGVLSLVQDLEEVQRIQASDLERSVRAQLGRWEGTLHTLQSVVEYSDSVRTLVQSPGGGVLLIGTNGPAYMVEAASGQTIGNPLSHKERLTSAVFRRDGEVLITGSLDRSVRFWNTRTAEEMGSPILLEEPAGSLALSSDDRVLAIASGAKIQFWDVESREQNKVEFDQGAFVKDIAFSPNSPWIIAGDATGVVKVWNVETQERVGPDWKLRYPLMDIAVSPDGKFAATCDIGNEVRIWFVATGESAGAALPHFGLVTYAQFSSNGKQLLTASADQTARLWDVASKSMIGPPLRHPAVVNIAVFDPNGRSVWTGCSDKGLRRWQLANGKSVPLELGQNGNVISASFNQEETAVRMIVGAIVAGKQVFPGNMRRWNLANGALIGEPSSSDKWRDVATFSHFSNLVAAFNGENAVQLYKVADGEPTSGTFQVTGEVSVIEFSHDDSLLLVGTKDGKIQLWNVATGEPARSEIQLESRITSAAFFPDNQRFLIGSWDQTARIYSVSNASNAKDATSILLKDENLVTSVDVSQDGSMLIICFGDGTLRLWNAKTNQQIGSVMKILPRPKFAMFGKNGETILTSAPDGSTRQWDVRSRIEIGPPLRQSKETTAIAQSKDGRWLATASSDWTARLWDIRPAVGSCEELKAQFELLTGSKLEKDGELQILSIADWRKRKESQKP